MSTCIGLRLDLVVVITQKFKRWSRAPIFNLLLFGTNTYGVELLVDIDGLVALLIYNARLVIPIYTQERASGEKVQEERPKAVREYQALCLCNMLESIQI